MIRERPFAACRRAAGLTLHQAAARLRVNAHYLRTLELGHSPLSIRLAGRMATEYGTTIRLLTQPASGAGRTGANGRGASGNAPRPPGGEPRARSVG